MNNYNRLPFFGVVVLVCLLALFGQTATAQVVSGSMVGNVTDAGGGSVSGGSCSTRYWRRARRSEGPEGMA